MKSNICECVQGFIGSHLVDRLLLDGHYVIVVDNMHRGSIDNINHWLHHPRLEFIHHDVIQDIRLETDQIYHLAAPTSLSYWNVRIVMSVP